MNRNPKTIEVRVFRLNPAIEKEPHYDVYRVPFVEGLSVSNVLQYINENYDGGLGHYLSCKRGLCQGCIVKVNNHVVLACTEIIHGDITIEPIKQDSVIKDLITNRKTED